MAIEESATTSSRNSAGGGEHRVIRSEVWSRFRLEGLNAVCLVCNEKLKVGPTRQTSSLWRHLKRHNRVAAAQNQRIPSGFLQIHPQSQLYIQQQQQQMMRSRSNNGFAALNGGDGTIQQQQKGAVHSHASRALSLHQFRLQQQQQMAALRAAPATAQLHNNFQHQNHHPQQQQQQNYRHVLHPSSSSSTAPFSQQQSASPPPSSAVEIPLTHPPLVTVDCKPVQNRELDQLLGICREEGEEQQEYDGTISSSSRRGGTEQDDEFIMINDEDDNDDKGEEEERDNDEGIMEEEEDDEDEEGQHEQETLGREWELARTLTEFLLENALPFHRLLFSSTFSSLLRFNQSVPKSLPSPAFLLQRMVPKLFAKALEERKMHFNNEFFVLTLNKIELDSPKQTALLRVTARKLSDCFSLCSRSLGQFAFDCSVPYGMSNALRQCFEEGSVRLHLWQISAIVHDGAADSEELCRQLDVPGIPSFHSLIRRTYTELDRLGFPLEIVTQLKKRFENAVDEILGANSPTNAFSVLFPPLIDRIDRFFREEKQNQLTTVEVGDKDKTAEPTDTNEEKKSGNSPISIGKLKKLLLDKFQLLWEFQRRKMAELETAQMTLFLNPSNLCGEKMAEEGQEFFGESKWHETAEKVREQISQACEEGEESAAVEGAENEGTTTKTSEEIQSEVTNYMATARLELGHPSTSSNCVDPSSPPLATHFNSLAELLFWWRINAERFPRLVQLARQFCAVPMANSSDQWKAMSNDDYEAEEEKVTRRYAAEQMAEDGDMAELESGRTEQLQLLTQLMTVRMALRERATETNENGKKRNECTAPKEEEIRTIEPIGETPVIK
ncbi:hypothetical protein niasHS_013142 [Heterodera schachtii]|uniref:BED-type domain-containing protein n=1 Tax=Heterodera schachtii TaxID=97005 RepID=A0ABD2ILR1_HETSC